MDLAGKDLKFPCDPKFRDFYGSYGSTSQFKPTFHDGGDLLDDLNIAKAEILPKCDL
jgi:hypothetical protein